MKKWLYFLLLFNCMIFYGCAQTSPDSATDHIRDNTPKILTPSADGQTTLSCNAGTIDISHTDQGYCMVNYTGDSDKAKIQLETPDSVIYTYALHGGYETFPLTGGNGTYRIVLLEHAHDDLYTTAYSDTFQVTLENEFYPYLYPNQYVNFHSDNAVIQKGKELAAGAKNDLDVVTNVYNFMAENISYDNEKSQHVENGYLPDVDEILASKTGICFDYAAVMASMLRSQGIPTKMEIGYAKDAYHAWVSVYLNEIGWVNGIIEFDGISWKLMDPTFASTQSEKKLKKFIENDSNYITKYIY